MRYAKWAGLALLVSAPACAQQIMADGFEPGLEIQFERMDAGGDALVSSDVVLAWDSPQADECTALGTGPLEPFPFDGARPAAGLEVLPLAQPGLYRFILVCRQGTRSASRLIDVTAVAPAPGAPAVLFDIDATEVEAGEHNTGFARVSGAGAGVQCTTTHQGPGVTAWPASIGTGARRELTAAAAGLHAFSVTCSDGAASTTITRHVNVVEPEGCDIPGIRPDGWLARDRSWSETFSSPDGSPVATWPSSVSFPVPQRVPRGGWTSVGFVAEGPAHGVHMFSERAIAFPAQGYPSPSHAVGMFIAISPCRGDVRPRDPLSSDPFLHQECRSFAISTTLVAAWGEWDQPHCPLEAGKRYFYTFVAANPADGLAPGESTCENDAAECEVSARHGGF